MALLDFLKKKEDAKKSVKKPEKPAKSRGHLGGPATIPPKADLGGKAPNKSAPRNLTGKTKTSGFSFEAIKEPHISEKATYLSEKDQYTFQVGANFNKSEIKKSVSGIYGVDILSVNIIKIPAKKRRLGKTQGWRKGYKKAIVTIKQGQKIEII